MMPRYVDVTRVVVDYARECERVINAMRRALLIWRFMPYAICVARYERDERHRIYAQ